MVSKNIRTFPTRRLRPEIIRSSHGQIAFSPFVHFRGIQTIGYERHVLSEITHSRKIIHGEEQKQAGVDLIHKLVS